MLLVDLGEIPIKDDFQKWVDLSNGKFPRHAGAVDERPAYAAVIGKLVLRLRSMRGLSQGQLATAAGLSQSALSRFENGQTLPDAYELRALANALGDKPDHFMARIEEAFARTRDAARKVSPGTPWGDIAAAGALTALAIVGVAAMLDDANKKAGRKKG